MVKGPSQPERERREGRRGEGVRGKRSWLVGGGLRDTLNNERGGERERERRGPRHCISLHVVGTITEPKNAQYDVHWV